MILVLFLVMFDFGPVPGNVYSSDCISGLLQTLIASVVPKAVLFPFVWLDSRDPCHPGISPYLTLILRIKGVFLGGTGVCKVSTSFTCSARESWQLARRGVQGFCIWAILVFS